MSGKMRAWLAGASFALIALSGWAHGQSQVLAKPLQVKKSAINLGKPFPRNEETNQAVIKTSGDNAGGLVTFTSGRTAVAYPPADLLSTNVASSGSSRGIMPPVTPQESQLARASRVFPSNLNEGAVPNTDASSPGLFQVSAIAGDKNARGPASIAELARALRYDPDLIYLYVHNIVEFYPVFGIQKGAFGALLDNQGTAYDQAALMVELLRASGIEARYVRGAVKVSGAELASWYGVDTSDNCAVLNLLAQGQIPVYELKAVREGACPGTPSAVVSATIEHVWVKAQINGAWYAFDPSYKQHAIKTGIDLASDGTTGYNAARYLTDANALATRDVDWVQNINRVNVRKNLASYAENLAGYLRKNKPTATLDDVIGGKTIEPFFGQLRQATLPNQDTSATAELSAIPNSLKPTLQIQYQGINQTFTSDAIYGRRLTITYNAANQPLLKLDGTTVGQPGTAAPPGSPTTIRLSVVHNAYWSTITNQQVEQTITAGGTNTYLIANGWGMSGRGPTENFRTTLDDLRSSATTNVDGSEAVLGTTLAMIGAQWMAEGDQSAYVTGRLAKTVLFARHHVGIVGYVNSAYVDFTANMYGFNSMASDYAAEDAAFTSTVMHLSILESTAVEQSTGVSAVSTVKLIDTAAAAGQRIYGGTAARFATFVQPYLGNCASQLPAMKKALDAGSRVITPARCDITENTWSGSGYLTIGPGSQVGSMISGGFAGGIATMNATASKLAAAVSNNQPSPASLQGNPITIADPIDMVQGNFLYNHGDIDSGVGSYPQTLAFERFYNSGRSNSSGTLGRGWAHNFNADVTVGSDGFQAMGEDSALDAVAALVEQKVSLDLLMDSARPLSNLVVATLGQRWFGDQLTNNTVIVKQGAGGEVFVKLPDGTYNPPPHSSAKLIRNADGTFSYESLNRAVLKFNVAGKAESYTETSGLQIKYSYTGNDVKNVQNSFGRSLTFAYVGGKLTSVNNGVSTVSYGYDGDGNLSSFTDALGKKTTYTYSRPGKMASIFYPSFPTVAGVTNDYDSLGRVKTQTNALGNTYQYFFAGSRTEEIAPGGITRTYFIDGQGNVIESSTPLLNFTFNTYDGQSRLIRTELPEGNATEYTYDDATCASVENRCTHNIKTIRKVGPSNSSVVPLTQSFTYDSAFNRVSTITDPNGNSTQFTYTAQGLPLTVTSPPDQAGNAPTTSYGYTRYEPKGYPPVYLETQTTVATSPGNDVVNSTVYDAGANYEPIIRTTDAGARRLNLTETFYYDDVGNVTMTQHPGASTNIFTYDAARRVTSSKDDAGVATTTAYDPDGRPVAIATQLGTQWMTICRRYSASGKVVREWGPSLTPSATTCPAEAAPVAIVDTAYDALDRVSLVTQHLTLAQGGNRVTETVYNDDDTVDAIYRAAGTSQRQAYATYQYTPNGNLEVLWDAKDNVMVYTYDVFDRRSRAYFAMPGATNTYNLSDYEETTYDANGNVTAMRRRNGQTVLQTWDKLNRLVARTYPTPAENLQFTYDLRGLRTEAKYASGGPADTYVWDNAGRLISSTADGRKLGYQYDASGNRARLTWPDGFYVTTEYDSRKRPMKIRENGDATLASLSYDNLGRRTNVGWGNGSTTQYQFDAQGLLSSLEHRLGLTASSVLYTYQRNQAGDLSGISWSNDAYQWKGAVSGTRKYTANGLNQYQSISGTTYNYDANGNLVSDGVSSYTYDLDNRLRTANRAGATLSYDPEGRLKRTLINGTTTDLLYDGVDLIAEYGSDGTLLKRYVHGPGTDEAIVLYEGAGTTAKTWMYADHQGSIVATAGSGGTGSVFAYGPHGESAAVAGSGFGYTGQRYFGDLELYYYKARFYNPRIGRFLQTDPAGTKDDLNLYAYVGNNPVNRVDPTGLAKVAVGDATVVAQRGRPITGDAGSYYVHPLTGDGRRYGDDGKPVLDFDISHSHGEMIPHIHIWRDGKRGDGESLF